MTRVGIVGLGCMGRTHFGCYKALEGVEVAALCDSNEDTFKKAGAASNISGAEAALDLSGIELYSDFDRMLAQAKLDAVSICLPTFMHAEYSKKALAAGVNVLCEKPMSISVAQCDEMVDAAKKSGKMLMIGHCIRFWPEYAKTKEIMDSGEYGNVMAASFERLSHTPGWSWKGWLLDGSESGGAVLDLHIHDSDFVQYAFGMPGAVSSRAVKGPSKGYDHIVTQYIYDDDKVVTAEGGWMMTPSFGFRMSFDVTLEKAIVAFDCTREKPFTICPRDGDAFTPELAPGDGYSQEIAHFMKAVQGEQVPEVLTPEQSRDSVRLVEAEIEAADTGTIVALDAS